MTGFLSIDEYNQIATVLGRHMSPEVLARRFLSMRFSDFKVGELRDIQRWLRTNKQPTNPYWSKPSQPKKEATISNIVRGIEHYKANQNPEVQPGTNQQSSYNAASYAQPNGHSYNNQPVNPAVNQSSYPASYGQPAHMNGNNPYVNNYTQPRMNGQPPAPYDRNNPGLNRSYQPQQIPQYPPQNIESAVGELLTHPNFARHRSPYEIVHSTLSKAWLGAAGNAFSARAYLQFPIPPQFVARLRKKPNSAGDMWVQLRLFSQQALDHVMLGAGSRVRVNAHDIPIPDLKKLSKAKKKGLELARPLNITEHLSANNYVEIELMRQQITGPELFRGLAVVELCSERSTQDLISLIQKQAESQLAATNQPANPPQPSYKINPKQCSVCQSTKDLLRCSRCKNEWYCGEEHQRSHWSVHRTQCHPPSEQQQREQEAFERSRDNPVVSSVQPLPRARNGRILLTMPTKVKPEIQVSSHPGGDDDDVDDEIAEVDTKVSLKDPVSLERLEIAAKGRACAHLPCFDVATFLQFSQQSGVWQCPICYVPVPFEELTVDREMNAILSETDSECAQIRVQPNGEWEPINEEDKRATKKQRVVSQQPATATVVDILDEDDSSVNQSTITNGSSPSSPYRSAMNGSAPAWSHYDPDKQSAAPTNHDGLGFLMDEFAPDAGATLEDAIELD